MRVPPYYSREVTDRMRAAMELHTGLFMTPQTRGYLLLGSVALAMFIGGFMCDDVFTPTYVLAFIPLYVCLLLTVFDTFSAKATYLPRTERLAGIDTTHRALKESWVRVLTWALWTVVLVLTPLLLEGLKTVYASCVTTLVALWIVAVIVAQYCGQESILRPITLLGIAGYLTGPGTGVPEPIDIEKNPSNTFGVTSPEEDADGIFDQKEGTVRGISTRESLRGSPQTAAKQGLLLVEDNELTASSSSVRISNLYDRYIRKTGSVVDLASLDDALEDL